MSVLPRRIKFTKLAGYFYINLAFQILLPINIAGFEKMSREIILESFIVLENPNICISVKMLISKAELDSKGSRDLVPLECYECKKTHFRTKNIILRILNGNLKNTRKGYFCSQECLNNYDYEKSIVTIFCKNCNKKTVIYQSSLSPNNFCSSSCAATYNNTHKTKGCRRSKLEIWMENQLTKLYPHLKIDYNKTDAIKAELDIYIPSLKLAFELNGIFHYEPIFGESKLDRIQNNDTRKFQACLERGIEMCIIDVSTIKYCKESTSTPILKIIQTILNKKLEPEDGAAPSPSHYK